MFLEYALYDIATNETEFKESVTQVLKYKIDVLSVLPLYLKIAKTLAGDLAEISCPIDYPMGLMDMRGRCVAAEQAIKNGAKIIDVVCPSILLSNRKYDKFREDIRTLNDLCLQENVQLRYFLEYRVYSYELLYKIAQILYDLGVASVLPSTGYLLDDVYDNILASGLINKKVPNINIVCNGNIWNNQQVDTIKKANLYGVRVSSLNALKLLKDQNV